jgi:hypothetical protein
MVSLLDATRKELFELLDACPGDKCLVMDPAVAGPLKLVLFEGPSVLRQVSFVFHETTMESDLQTMAYLI